MARLLVLTFYAALGVCLAAPRSAAVDALFDRVCLGGYAHDFNDCARKDSGRARKDRDDDNRRATLSTAGP